MPGCSRIDPKDRGGNCAWNADCIYLTFDFNCNMEFEAALQVLFSAAVAVIAWIGLSGIRRGLPKPVKLIGGWGTVYLFQDRENPHLLKVGTTRRLSKIRKGEVSETMTGGCHLVQIFAVDMPFAHTAETLAHRRLRRYRHHSERGREWYRLEGEDGIAKAIEAIEAAAKDVRKMAQRRRKWSVEADKKARSWRLSNKGPTKQKLFLD